jgi:NADH dehydrogenase [ubiquinone] 1 alpha subcomplex assembly factor 1
MEYRMTLFISLLSISTIFNVKSEHFSKTNKGVTLSMSNRINNQDVWKITNDGVMGGLSSGEISVIDDNVKFTGHISIDNNGGFTSVFRSLTRLPENMDTIRISVIGDGNTYQLRLRSQVQGYILAYKAYFMTSPNKLESHTFKLTDFKASFRGRNINNAPLLEASSIEQVGFLFTAKQPQKFSLSIQSIDFSAR